MATPNANSDAASKLKRMVNLPDLTPLRSRRPWHKARPGRSPAQRGSGEGEDWPVVRFGGGAASGQPATEARAYLSRSDDGACSVAQSGSEERGRALRQEERLP